MSKFKILNNLNESLYFREPDWATDDEEYYYQCTHFHDYVKENFFNELKKHDEVKKQAGYSRKRDCNYISLILVFHNSGDMEFNGHTIESTCLIKKNGKITDSNNNSDVYDEVGHTIGAIYHKLPDGKLVEYSLEKSYEDDLENIYEYIKKVRSYYELDSELPINQSSKKIKQLKL